MLTECEVFTIDSDDDEPEVVEPPHGRAKRIPRKYGTVKLDGF